MTIDEQSNDEGKSGQQCYCRLFIMFSVTTEVTVSLKVSVSVTTDVSVVVSVSVVSEVSVSVFP